MGISLQPTTPPRPRPGEPGYVAPVPGAPGAPLPAGIPLAPGTSAGGLTPTGTGPTNPAGVDRIGLATQSFDRMQAARAPQDRLAREGITSQAAGLGQLGSGQWRQALTTADNNRQLQLDTQRDDLIGKATEGTIADAQEAARLGLAERNTQVAEGGLAVQQRGQDIQQSQFTATMAENVASRLQQGGQFTAQLAEQVASRIQNKSLADAQLELNRMVQTGQLTVAQGQLALSQLQTTNQAAQAAAGLAEQTAGRVQQGTQFTAGLAEQAAARTQQNTQFTTQLAQQATQFGASQEQQLQIARLADATQNRGLDLNSAQGKQQILVQMAQILGGPTGASNPQLLEMLRTALGLPAGTFGPTPPGGQGATPPGTTNPLGLSPEEIEALEEYERQRLAGNG